MADQANSGIYEIVNLVNGKRYIGSSVDLRRRENQHFANLERGTHHNKILQAAWRKYGSESFRFSVIEYCCPDLLIDAEQSALDRFKPEYNLAPNAGNLLGFKFPEDALLKIRGRKRSPESIAKGASAHRGMKRAPAARENMARAARGRKRRERSQDHRENLSKALKGKSKSPEHMARFQEGRRRQVFTSERRAAVSISLKLAYKLGLRSRERPPEYREKIAASLKGVKHSAERRAKQAAAQVGLKRSLYRLDPAKAEARSAAGRALAAAAKAARLQKKIAVPTS